MTEPLTAELTADELMAAEPVRADTNAEALNAITGTGLIARMRREPR